RRPVACVRLSKRRQLKVPASEGARLRTRWASENRLNRGVAEVISEVVLASKEIARVQKVFGDKKKNPKQRRVRSDQRRRVKCSQLAVKPLDLLSVRRSGESSDGEDCQSDPVQSQQGVLGWGSWNGAVVGADGEEQFCFVVLLRRRCVRQTEDFSAWKSFWPELQAPKPPELQRCCRSGRSGARRSRRNWVFFLGKIK
ncbi:hypothetical protein U1Q18_032132, partial [Sarracenia purpurea var. burkii]